MVMPVPFRIIDWYDYGFPECWKMIDFKMTDNNDGVVPIYKYYEKLMHFMLKFDLPDEETSYACASILLTMAIWRTNKQIFVFYKEMLEVLFEQKPDFNIPTEILNQLPYPCIYFDLNGFDNLEGMLVVKEEHEDGRKGLRFHLLAQIFYADAWFELCDSKSIQNQIDKLEAPKKKIMGKIIQCLLYVCCTNAKIEEDSEQKKRYRAPLSENYIKDKIREARIWNCGEKEPKIIYSEFGEYPQICSHEVVKHRRGQKGHTKRCHVRKSHWHHYWIGSAKDGTRKLELRWINAMTINKENYTESSVVKMNNVYVS